MRPATRSAVAVALLVASIGVSGCESGRLPTEKYDPFCMKYDTQTQRGLESMISTVAQVNSPDPDTQAIQADAKRLLMIINNPAVGGGPSSPDNVATFTRFKDFVMKKCHVDIGTGLFKK